MRLLLVEDDRDLSAPLAARLGAAAYVVDHAPDGEEGEHLGATGDYAAIILDLGLPVLDGLSVLGRLRARGVTTPILLLTARDGWRDRVKGLRAGADDYLCKPFESEELLARIEALVRRAGGHAAAELRVGPLTLDLGTRRVTKAGAPVALSPNEWRALACLCVNRGRVVSKAELGDQIYAEDIDRDPNLIEVTIARLRRKIGHGQIQTRRGHGYLVE